MRYWYDSNNLSWTSNDGYEIWLDSDIECYKLYCPDGFCLGVWFFDDLRKQIEGLDIKLYEYMFYKAERFLTVIGIKIEEPIIQYDELKNDYYHLESCFKQDENIIVRYKNHDN